ncbi:hypothetical protein ACIGMX_34645 [Streptomyces aquilus]|uniref:hypothetical protein n=1 Tax=Streptomyces aquilus TaxID=2548456 RepID=UPI0037CEA8A0
MSAPTTVQWLRAAIIRVGVGSGRRGAYLGAWIVHRGRRTWQRATGWLDEGEGFGWWLRLALLLLGAAILRKIVTALAVGIWHRIESGSAPWLLWGAATWWVVSAYRAGVEDWKPKRPAAPDTPPESDAPPAEEQVELTPADKAVDEDLAAEQLAAGPPLPILPDLRISLLRIGTPHAHITALADDLGTTAERVREALAKWGIPVEPVRMKGRPSSSTGVKGGPAVHPALAPRPEDVAVVAAGQPANNDNNNGFTTVQDEENPVRTHVVWRDQ